MHATAVVEVRYPSPSGLLVHGFVLVSSPTDWSAAAVVTHDVNSHTAPRLSAKSDRVWNPATSILAYTCIFQA